MSYDIKEEDVVTTITMDVITWTCDVRNCTATGRSELEIGQFSFNAKDYVPTNWSTVLMTSMDDGDMAWVLCPKHTESLLMDFKVLDDYYPNVVLATP